MQVRASRRDLDAADATLWLRAKLPVWAHRQRERLRAGLKRSVANVSHVSSLARSATMAPRKRGDAEGRMANGVPVQAELATLAPSVSVLSDRI